LRAWQAAAVLLRLTTLGAGAAWRAARATGPALTRFIVAPPDGGAFLVNGRPGAAAAIAPDGLKIAFSARDAAGKVLLWVRRLDSLAAQPLLGTDEGTYPFWSPDSRFIGYSTRSGLMKVPVSGGPPQTLCAFSAATVVGRGGAWSRDDVIVFNNGPNRPLFRVASAGGTASAAWALPPGHADEVFPSFLPDGRHVLFSVEGATSETSGVYAASLETGEAKRIVGADSGAIYSPSDGHLLFVRQGTLMAQSFDPNALAVANDPFPIAQRVEFSAIPGLVAFSVSDTGILSYGVGAGPTLGPQMAWVDRQGKLLETIGPPASYQGLALSPDGTRVAAHRHEGRSGDIWVTELTRGMTTRFTFDASHDSSSPVWSPDGNDIAFASFVERRVGIYRKAANNAGSEELLSEGELPRRPLSWAPDGRTLVFVSMDVKSSQDLWTLPLAGNRQPAPWLQTPFNENEGRIAPGGKWIAYQSNETGRFEVYVRPFPSGAGKWLISGDGGGFPSWRSDGREIFYLTRNLQQLVAVETNARGSVFEIGAARELFAENTAAFSSGGGHPYSNYAPSADGQRFLVARSANRDNGPSAIAVVVNWQQTSKP
jgi:Tol biopolymer transport system component